MWTHFWSKRQLIQSWNFFQCRNNSLGRTHREVFPASIGNILLCDVEAPELGLLPQLCFPQHCWVQGGLGGHSAMIICKAWSRTPRSAHPLGHLWPKDTCYRQGNAGSRSWADKNFDKVSKITHSSSKVGLTGLISQSTIFTIFFRIRPFHSEFSANSESASIMMSPSFCLIFFSMETLICLQLMKGLWSRVFFMCLNWCIVLCKMQVQSWWMKDPGCFVVCLGFFWFLWVFFRGKNVRRGIKAEEFWDLGGSWVHSQTKLLRAYSGNFLISPRMHIQHPFLSNLLFFPCCS